MNTEICPRCYGSPNAYKYCALCHDKGSIPSLLALKYKELIINSEIDKLPIRDTLELKDTYENRERIIYKMIIEKLMILNNSNFNLAVDKIQKLLDEENKPRETQNNVSR